MVSNPERRGVVTKIIAPTTMTATSMICSLPARTLTALDAFEPQADELVAVASNSESQSVIERLPAVERVEIGGKSVV